MSSTAAPVLTVFISQNRFGPAPPPQTRSAQLTLPAATSSTLDLVSYAHALLTRFWQPAHTYVKAGVILDGFEGAGQSQLSLSERIEKAPIFRPCRARSHHPSGRPTNAPASVASTSPKYASAPASTQRGPAAGWA